jgi:hypothetical protein
MYLPNTFFYILASLTLCSDLRKVDNLSHLTPPDMKNFLISLGTVGTLAFVGFAGQADAYSYIAPNYYTPPNTNYNYNYNYNYDYQQPYYGNQYYGGGYNSGSRCYYYGSDGACYNYSTFGNSYYPGYNNYNYHFTNRSTHPYELRDRYNYRRTYDNCRYSYCDRPNYWYTW